MTKPLADPAGLASPEAPPQWFTDAMAAQVECGSVEVDRTTIACRTWDEPGPAGLVLVHCGAAHARWWDHIGPTAGHRPSGHSD